jgi:lipopolysaccharide/colanic/teichoic acid biosynthesis glycosyltransferase
MRPPSSRASLAIRLYPFDLGWALIAPLLAFHLRDTEAFYHEWATSVPLYCVVSAAISIMFFSMLRLRAPLISYFTTRDVWDVVKAGLLISVSTSLAVFTLTRLDGVPRSTPVIHAIILVSGLLVARACAYYLVSQEAPKGSSSSSRHIILVGANHMASAYIRLLRSYSDSSARVVGVLDDRRYLCGREIAQVRILGTPTDLESVIDEFRIHGILVTDILVAGSSTAINSEAADHLFRICNQWGLDFDYLPALLKLPSEPESAQVSNNSAPMPARFAVVRYLTFKRFFDAITASLLLLMFLPLLSLASLLVLVELGSPVLFWQQRLGKDGRTFFVYKFRTLRAPFDTIGRPVEKSDRPSALGGLLRKTHLDELPQLLNVVKGDMSLVGPRPLLPVDQPADPTVRLSVRPGMSGWAQLHGGKLLSAEEKNKLDEWYVKNASFTLDCRILVHTLKLILVGGTPEVWQGDAALGDPKSLHKTS